MVLWLRNCKWPSINECSLYSYMERWFEKIKKTGPQGWPVFWPVPCFFCLLRSIHGRPTSRRGMESDKRQMTFLEVLFPLQINSSLNFTRRSIRSILTKVDILKAFWGRFLNCYDCQLHWRLVIDADRIWPGPDHMSNRLWLKRTTTH